MERQPAARASAARDNLANSDKFRPGTVDKIRATIPPESMKAIDETLGSSWLPFEHDHWLMDGTIEVLGVDDSVECWRRSIGYLIERPLLKSFVEGSLRLFGGRPGMLLKMIPKGWSLAYRDFCAPSYRLIEAGHAELRFEQIAPQAFESPGYIHCWHGVSKGLFDLEKPENGRVSFEIDASRALAIATFRWD